MSWVETTSWAQRFKDQIGRCRGNGQWQDGNLQRGLGEASRDWLLPVLPWSGHVDDLCRYSLLVVLARVEN